MLATLQLMMVALCDAIGDLGVDCRRDLDCTQSDPNLRCYSKPGLADFGDKRCQCRYKWKFRSGLCRPPDGWSPGAGEDQLAEESGDADYIVVLMPSFLLATVTLVISLCCCYYIHSGNRELHRELKQYTTTQVVRDKYLVEEQETSIPKVKSQKIKQEEFSAKKISNDESDSDSGLFEMADLSRADIIQTETVPHEIDTSIISTAQVSHKMTRASSVLSVRNLEEGTHRLHPLNGLVQQTGLVPQRGYQANMRLLFNQRPESASSQSKASRNFLLKSRPASAISRFSTASRPTSAFNRGNYDNTSDEEDEISVPKFKKSINGPFKNGHNKTNGNVVNQKFIEKDSVEKQKEGTQKQISETKSPLKSVTYSKEGKDSGRISRQGSSTVSKAHDARPESKSGRNSLSSTSSSSSRPSSSTTETVMEKIMRYKLKAL